MLSPATEFVGSQKKITEKDIEAASLEIEIKEFASQLIDTSGNSIADPEDLKMEMNILRHQGNIKTAYDSIKAERLAEKEKAAKDQNKTPTKVAFTPELATRLLKVKMEGGAARERTQKRQEELRRAAEMHSRGGGKESVAAEAEAFASMTAPSVAEARDSMEPEEGAEAVLRASIDEFVSATEEIDGKEGGSEVSNSGLATTTPTTLAENEAAISTMRSAVTSTGLEIALKRLYEERRNMPEVAGAALESLTRTLYEKRYAGVRLAKEVSLVDPYAEPGSPSAVLQSTARDAALLGGDVIANESLLEEGVGVGKKYAQLKKQNEAKARQFIEKEMEVVAEARAEEEAVTTGNIVDPTSMIKNADPRRPPTELLRPLKPLSAFSPRERKNYSKAVAEMNWIEEWAVQEIIMAFHAAEGAFEGSAEEYRLQLERVRDTIHEAVINKIDQAVHERLAGKPLAYILGSAKFLDTEILCEQPVMCPTSETEHWVGWLTYTLSEAAIEEATPKQSAAGKAAEVVLTNAHLITTALRRSFLGDTYTKFKPNKFKFKPDVPEDPTNFAHNTIDVLDLCCGSGAIGIAIAKSIVGANVVALDVLPEAVKLARRNAMHNRIPKWKYRAEESDMFALVVHNALYREKAEKAKAIEAAAAEAEERRKKKASDEAKAKEAKEGNAKIEAPSDAAAVVPASSTTALSASTSTERAAEAAPVFIPNMEQLVPNILSEEELHATMHFLSKAARDGEERGGTTMPITYDLIVCNPPNTHPDDYAAAVEENNGVAWDSELAIVGDPRRARAQELYFRDLCILGHKFSKPIALRPAWIPKACPSICFEVGLQGQVIADLFTQSKLWDNVLLHVDAERRPRWITAIRKDFDW